MEERERKRMGDRTLLTSCASVFFSAPRSARLKRRQRLSATIGIVINSYISRGAKSEQVAQRKIDERAQPQTHRSIIFIAHREKNPINYNFNQCSVEEMYRDMLQ